MSPRFALLFTVIVGFGVLTTIALLDIGYLGIVSPHFQSWGAAQVLADLVIVSLLACIWMVKDARASGRTAWPYIVITLVAGSFGTLLYLAIGELRSRAGRTDQA